MKNLLAPAASKAAKLMTKIKVNSPTILIVAGISSIGFGFALTIRNTLKCKEEVEAHQTLIEDFKDKTPETAETYGHDLTVLYARKALIFVKHYAGPAALMAGGISAVIGSHYILKMRNASLLAAYGALDEAYKRYRARVREKIGEDEERKLYLGMREEKKLTAIEAKEDGTEEKIEVKNGMTITDPTQISEYARFFDESSACWQKSSEYNKMFLVQMQNQLNDKLKARGHMFLNEVYDALGFERTQAGNVVGWVIGNGDDFIDFGIYDVYTEPRRAAFINGFERSILLDFNVDGVILNKI